MERWLFRIRLAFLVMGVLAAGKPLGAQEEDFEEPVETRSTEPTTASVSGRLTLSGGAPPPELARVELICADQLVGQSYADSKGRFRIDVNDRSGLAGHSASIDGSEHRLGSSAGDVGILDRYRSCELQISFLGTHPMRVAIQEAITGFGADLGTIIVGQGADSNRWMSATSYGAPRKAQSAYAKASVDLRKGRIEPAERRLREAVAIYHEYAAAWHALGIALASRGALEEACDAFGWAIAADRDYAPPYSPLMRARADLNHWREVSVIALRLQELVGGEEPLFYRALALWNLDRREEAAAALVFARQAATDAYRPVILLLSAEIHAAAERWPQAAKDYREYLARAPASPARVQIERTLDAWETAGLLGQTRTGFD